MKADSLKMSKVFSGGGDVHYILPHFQREYAWDKTNWQILLSDILGIYDAYNPDKEPEHFMGSLVVINDGTRNGTVPAFKLVDGQQRLTSISLLLCTLGRLSKESHPGLKNKIQKLLVNPDEIDLLHFKLLPTVKYGDREIYRALIKDEQPLPITDSKILEAFNFFYKELESKIKFGKLDPERLFIVISNCLQVVFIDLNQEERPYEIFESLNAKGKPLSQADLVRNYIAMRLPEARQGEIFDKYWSVIENLLQEKRTVGKSRLGELTAFLRHYLAFRNEILCNEEHVYARFRDRIEKDFNTSATFEKEVATLKRFAEYYNRLLRPEYEKDTKIREALNRLNILEISTAYPFLLAVYESYTQNQIKSTELLEGLKILENYIVRRYITHEPTNYLNKMFPTLYREIDKSQFIQSLRRVLVLKNYPSDNRIREAVIGERIYDRRSETRAKINLVLQSINRYLSEKCKSGGYTILNDEPTIEHIMPQTLDSNWKVSLGDNWEQVVSTFLDTLGNLTLVTQEWNSSLSNSSFILKKGKFTSHALLLNSEYFSQPMLTWGENEIRSRAEWLSDCILEIWPALGIPPMLKTSYSKPTKVIVMGQTFIVSSWRDVAYYTVKSICDVIDEDDFTQLVEQFPSYLDNHEFKQASRQLPNGWWLYVNLSGASVKNFCRNFIAAANLSVEDWRVEEE